MFEYRVDALAVFRLYFLMKPEALMAFTYFSLAIARSSSDWFSESVS